MKDKIDEIRRGVIGDNNIDDAHTKWFCQLLDLIETVAPIVSVAVPGAAPIAGALALAADVLEKGCSTCSQEHVDQRQALDRDQQTLPVTFLQR